jgi:Ca2+-binding EF-hand superfamily protein
MRTACLTLASLLSMSVFALAGAKPTVTVAPAKPAVDLAKGAVDPYDRIGERARFFRAAGVDNELDAKEFAAAQKIKDSFVRSFDRWEWIRRHDKDNNGTIDWFEADAYRRGLRDRVLKAFDTDKDGKLKGAERDKANTALASGRVPGEPASAGRGASAATGARRWVSTGGAGQVGAGGSVQRSAGGWGYTRPEDLKAHDTDGDGELSNDERQAMYKARQEQWRVTQHDKDKDGKLNDAEREAMEAEKARRAEQIRKYREQAEQQRKEQLATYDTDGDGQLSNDERQAMYKAMREQWMVKRHDKDKDGKLDDAEREAMEAEQARWAEQAKKYREQAEQRRKEQLATYDADGDGKLSGAERQVMFKAMREQWQERSKVMRERSEQMRKDADADGDGQTSGGEWRDFWQKTRKKYDADADGQLDATERQKMMRGLYGESYGRSWVYPGVGVNVGGASVTVGGVQPLIRTRTSEGETVTTSKDGKTTVIIRRVGPEKD